MLPRSYISKEIASAWSQKYARVENRWSEIFLSQNKTFLSDSDLGFLQSSWHSLPAFNKVCSGFFWAKSSDVPLPLLTFSCSCCHWSYPSLGCSSPLETLTSLESHFVIMTHFESCLSHFELHFVIFWPFNSFLWGCPKDPTLALTLLFPSCLLVLLSTNK